MSLVHALAQYARGFSLFPIPAPIPGTPEHQPGDGKTPAKGMRWTPYQTRRASESQVRAWFGGTPRNIAAITGAVSDIVVVDGDSAEALRLIALRLPYTPWQVRTRDGRQHFYFRHPGVPVRNKARIKTGDDAVKIDVRGDGGYVIGPGSVHMSGVVYTPTRFWDDPAEYVPVFDPKWLELPKASAPPTLSRRPLMSEART